MDLQDAFKDLVDPRIERNKRHRLEDILILTICAFICGANTWTEVEEFGRAKRAWFDTFVALPHGIPSHDTLGRLFARLDPAGFRQCFITWMEAVAHVTQGEVVAIDGKTLRRSYDRAGGKSAIHMVSAWAAENSVVLGQTKTEDKSNEITAIPALLDLLALEGCIVTIDAMGCQKAIAETIVDQDADYVLALKGNQGQLYDNVRLFFDTGVASGFGDIPVNIHKTVDADHGRIETRRIWATTALDGIVDPGQWPGLRSIGMVESEREVDGQTTIERRYYISSLDGNAAQLGAAVRAHWGIENRLHWCLDVAFREDENRVRKDNGPDNMAMLRHLTLNLLRQETTCKRGLRTKRLKAGWDEQYLFKVLTAAS